MNFKHIIFLIWIGVVLMNLFGCSSETSQYSPEQVINNALDDSSEPESFYGEGESITIENDEIMDESVTKEWRTADGKIRLETTNKEGEDLSIAVNDGSKATIYLVEENEAIILDDPELLASNRPTPKEQAHMLLDMVRESHDISVAGEEEIAGRETYHIIAEPREKNALFGKQELWVDKETWMVLKVVTITGDIQGEMAYTKVDYHADISPELFDLELPPDVKIENMDAMMDLEEEISLEEVAENIGKPVLYFPENEQMQISSIEKVDLKGELQRTEVTINYEQDNLPLFSLSVFESPEDPDINDLTIPGEETIEIRNQDGTVMDSEMLRTVWWEEDGISYSIILIDPGLTIEKFVNLADNMKQLE